MRRPKLDCEPPPRCTNSGSFAECTGKAEPGSTAFSPTPARNRYSTASVRYAQHARLPRHRGISKLPPPFSEEGRLLAQQASTPAIQGQLAYAAGIIALASGAAADASSDLERSVELLGSNQTGELYISSLTILAWSYELRGQMTQATEHYRRLLSITEAQGELLYRSAALRGLGVSAWLQGERDRAQQLLKAALRINRRPNSPVFTAFSLEALAWTTADKGDAQRAAVLMGAAQGKWLVGTRSPSRHTIAASAAGSARYDCHG
ncbi:tetratricopeptide repeat protein [Nocardia vinacea]|uniref:tetratricopeptide repeat protein n=1 Tax=Nocardia vinacea TaxID=96468 RepID=UPI0033C66E01